MGYTHYWYRKLEYSQEQMHSLAEDFGKIVLTLDSMGVRLADGLGEGVPEITDKDIRFNGLSACGHPENSAVSIPWPTQNASGVIDGRGQVAGGWFAGAMLDSRCCDGDCSYETFSFPREMGKTFLQSLERDGRKDLFFECCKTAYRPYDLAVTAFLVIAKHHLKDDIAVASDGELIHWIEAIELCRIYLGYEETYDFTGRDSHFLEPKAA